MFERFRDDARRVVVRSQEETRALADAPIGTEHLLLALLAETDDPGGEVLVTLGATHAKALEGVAGVAARGTGARPGHIAFTPRAKRVLLEAARVALGLGHNYVGSEHVVLGLLRVEDCTAVRVLGSMGITTGSARTAVLARFMNDRRGEDTRRVTVHLPPRAP